jgi:hypothetical protein
MQLERARGADRVLELAAPAQYPIRQRAGRPQQRRPPRIGDLT